MRPTDEGIARPTELAVVRLMVGVFPAEARGYTPGEQSEIEESLYNRINEQTPALRDAAAEAFDDFPFFVEVDVRVARGSIEILVILSAVLTAITKFNEVFAAVETALQNTRRIVERVSDAHLGSLSSPWRAQVVSRWTVSPRVLTGAAIAGEPERPTAPPMLAYVDYRRIVVWTLVVITYLTILFVAASTVLRVVD